MIWQSGYDLQSGNHAETTALLKQSAEDKRLELCLQASSRYTQQMSELIFTHCHVHADVMSLADCDRHERACGAIVRASFHLPYNWTKEELLDELEHINALIYCHRHLDLNTLCALDRALCINQRRKEVAPLSGSDAVKAAFIAEFNRVHVVRSKELQEREKVLHSRAPPMVSTVARCCVLS